MCGLAGFIERDPHTRTTAARDAILGHMGRRLSRRGPDDEQRYDDGRLAFVFRRLAIVDLATGQQPIWNEDRTLFVAVNGEIYNHADLRATLAPRHRLRTNSDAEVVLHLYEERGAAALDRLQGMFALAIWDTTSQRLFLARDRLGIKPLYYAETPTAFVFGSEPKALLAHPACPRDVAWHQVDTAAIASGGAGLPTYIRGVEQLPGGHHLTVHEGRVRTSCYWTIDRVFGASVDATAADVVEAYATLFADAARRHLMSEVPVGALLSGGLDSSLVVAAAATTTRDLHCFHVLEQTTRQSGDSAAAVALAESLGVPLHLVHFPTGRVADDLDVGLHTLEYYVWLMDAPRFHLEWFFKHEVHRYAKTHVPSLKVMLLGQGADEFAGGYSKAYVAGADSWSGYLTALARELQDDAHERAGLARPFRPLLGRRARVDDSHDAGSTFQREMRRRVRVLQQYNLWHEDRTAAGQGIEARVPFLDHRLIELLAAVPERLHATLFWDKRILRTAARRWLPASLTRRPKVGFYHARDMSSIDTLGRRIALRCYPAFRAAYLGSRDALFNADALDGLRARVEAGGRAGTEAQALLMTCMATAVFARHVAAGGAEPPMLDPPSPLRSADVTAVRSAARHDDAVPVWTLRTRVRLEPGVRVFDSAVGRHTRRLTLARDGVVGRDFDLPLDMRWMVRLMRALEQRPVGATVGALQQRLRVPRARLHDALTLLAAEGWVMAHTSG